MVAVNFILVYGVAGFILAQLLIRVGRKNIDSALAYLLGYGIAPIVVSLQLYYLYWLKPGQAWFFYAIIVHVFWLILLGTICRHIVFDAKQFLAAFGRLGSSVKKSSIMAKVLLGFVICLVGFVFIRGQLYPTIWDDAILYFQQGHVYAAHRSNNDLTYGYAYAPDGTDYVMNPIIRPAIPILYSFFYTKADTLTTSDIFIFSGTFLYFYYFILVLLLLAYILKRLQCDFERILIGLTLLTTCYYFINFLIYGFKEIILIFFLLAALYISNEITTGKTKTTLFWPALFGIVLGLSIFVNLSGVIITGVAGIVYVVSAIVRKLSIKKIVISLLVIACATVIFSGGELQNDFRFIFNTAPTSSAITTATIEKNKAHELVGYRIVQPTANTTTSTTQGNASQNSTSEAMQSSETELKTQLLIKGKFQGFTQIQFYGIIFPVFVLVLLMALCWREKFLPFTNNVLAFFWIFFTIVMDPFFLNHHEESYVLSISPKYTILLIPLVVLFVTVHYSVFQKIFAKINIKYFFASTVFLVLLISSIRAWAAHEAVVILQRFVPFYNTTAYYETKLNTVFLGLVGVAVIVDLITLYLVRQRATAAMRVNFIDTLWLGVGFILPFLFLLNGNYAVTTTFQHLFDSKTEKLEVLQASDVTIAFLKAINYLNSSTAKDSKILTLYPSLLMYYINDYHRFVPLQQFTDTDPTAKRLADNFSVSYTIVPKSDLDRYNFTAPTVVEQDFGAVVILRTVTE